MVGSPECRRATEQSVRVVLPDEKTLDVRFHAQWQVRDLLATVALTHLDRKTSELTLYEVCHGLTRATRPNEFLTDIVATWPSKPSKGLKKSRSNLQAKMLPSLGTQPIPISRDMLGPPFLGDVPENSQKPFKNLLPKLLHSPKSSYSDSASSAGPKTPSVSSSSPHARIESWSGMPHDKLVINFPLSPSIENLCEAEEQRTNPKYYLKVTRGVSELTSRRDILQYMPRMVKIPIFYAVLPQKWARGEIDVYDATLHVKPKRTDNEPSSPISIFTTSTGLFRGEWGAVPLSEVDVYSLPDQTKNGEYRLALRSQQPYSSLPSASERTLLLSFKSRRAYEQLKNIVYTVRTQRLQEPPVSLVQQLSKCSTGSPPSFCCLPTPGSRDYVPREATAHSRSAANRHRHVPIIGGKLISGAEPIVNPPPPVKATAMPVIQPRTTSLKGIPPIPPKDVVKRKHKKREPTKHQEKPNYDKLLSVELHALDLETFNLEAKMSKEFGDLKL